MFSLFVLAFCFVYSILFFFISLHTFDSFNVVFIGSYIVYYWPLFLVLSSPFPFAFAFVFISIFHYVFFIFLEYRKYIGCKIESLFSNQICLDFRSLTWISWIVNYNENICCIFSLTTLQDFRKCFNKKTDVNVFTPVWNHYFSMYSKFSEKLTFLTHWYAHIRVYTGGKFRLDFLENFTYVLY